MGSVTITEVRNARSNNAENTAFEVDINHPEYGWIPYGLDPLDEDMTIDNSALISLIGSDYVAYVAPTQAELDAIVATSIRRERDRRLIEEVDPIVSNNLRWAEFTNAKQTAWTQYRTDLLRLPEQSGFPNDVTWPTKPE